MPLRPFLNLFARLLLVALLMLALCAGLYAGINEIRRLQWQEQLAAPVLSWLAQAPHPLRYHDGITETYDIRLQSMTRLPDASVVRERLAYGQVVIDHDALGVRVRKAVSGDRLLVASFRDLYGAVSDMTGRLAVRELSRVPLPERRDAMRRLGARLHVLIDPLTPGGELPAGRVLDRLETRGMAMIQSDASDAATVYARLSDGSIIHMRMPPPFDPWAWPVVLTLLLVATALGAIFLYWLLRHLDQNLRSVESVAVRIARGEMEARVEAGQGTLIRRLANAFNGMAEHIQRLVSVQREMIHAVSHELRTPVARIRFGVQMLEDCPDDASFRKQLGGIDRDIQELDELIDEILTYARLEQGGPVMAFQKTDIPALIDQVMEEQQQLFADHLFETDCDDASRANAMADAEPRYIHRAVQNLVGNAARYARSRIRVRCRIDGETCRIDVEDDGPGIPESDWEKVFTAFARLDDSRTRESGGYGLGLSIVRRILYWHGGQAFVGRSDDLGGAAFTLVLPRQQKGPEG
ncbi:two-component system sensor histidine kinase RstB [Tamilnaduibacter salinus]|uniref:histidine kinase n=1 Tax=Tamilnaduibacter salinus TaxID=1484056 RepID=A0A2A2I7C6_9GAMM|nr:ATP-binding protein [Tamilnaduibacter salinus]PAV27216.1 two-component sensor histidine kinase [Tamilnaduibacter salinus]PVY78947.1 two-component system sensor histidine kinase RstB [Tamilnaduibacter salinus]